MFRSFCRKDGRGVSMQHKLDSATDVNPNLPDGYRVLFDRLPEPALVYDLQSRLFLDVNLTATAKYGYTRQEFLAMAVDDLRVKEARKQPVELPERFTMGGAVRCWRHRTKDGGITEVEEAASAIEFRDRHAVVVIVREATAHLPAPQASGWGESAAKQPHPKSPEWARAELAAILESPEAALITCDLNGNVVTWSSGAERIFGYKAREIAGRNLRITVPADHWRDREASDAKTRSGERVAQFETVILTSGGQRLEVLASASPIRDEAGGVIGSAHMVRDISESRRLQGQLAQAQKLESVGRLAAGIAHEINTPIQYVGDNAEFLKTAFQQMMPFILARTDIIEALRRGPRPDLAEQIESLCRKMDAGYLCNEVPKALDELTGGVEQVARIVRAMKEFSHPDAADKVMLDINRAIESTILVSKNEWKYVADLTADFDRDLPLTPCLAGEFNQVILNLIVNAAQAIAEIVKDSGRKGAIHIATCRNSSWVEIRVSDTGGGIPEELHSKIFDPFFTTKEVGKGTGQGLYIAHTVIAKKHGGVLSFESKPGVGTTFLVQLPMEVLTS
jgi:PAS domain S-box-containing protein